jgi:hypothetical protein
VTTKGKCSAWQGTFLLDGKLWIRIPTGAPATGGGGQLEAEALGMLKSKLFGG